MDRQTKIDRGIAVSALLESDHCKEAIEDILETTAQGILNSSVSDTKTREELYLIARCTATLLDTLQGYIDTGKLELAARKAEEEADGRK